MPFVTKERLCRLRREGAPASAPSVNAAVYGVFQPFIGETQSVREGLSPNSALPRLITPSVCPEKPDLLFGITLFDALERFSCIH